MNTCDGCKYWHDDQFGNDWGESKPCHHPKVKEFPEPSDTDDALSISTDIGTPIALTGPKFGCIHHDPK